LKKIVFLPPGRWATNIIAHDPNKTIDETSVQRVLTQQGIQVITVNPHEKPWNLLSGSNPYFRALDPLRALKILLIHRNADAIVVVFESGGVVLLLLRWLFRFRPKVVLWDASVGNPWRFLAFVQKIVFKRFDGLMMLTNHQIETLVARHTIRGRMLHLGYNVDESFFHPKYNAIGNYILSVGDDRSRDYDTLLEAIGPLDQFLKLKTRWRSQNTEFTAQIRLEYVSNRLNDMEFRELYGAARFVVLPLREVDSAGGITALFEAMAMGKAVIVTESGVSKDFVTDGLNAIVVPVGDMQALRAAMVRLIENPTLCDTLGRNARAMIDSNFSTRNLASQMATFITSLAIDQKQPI